MKRLLRHVSQVLPALLALGLAVIALRSADLERVGEHVRSVGWRLPLLLLPNLAVTLIEAVAWWRSFALLGVRPRFASLVGVRLVVEAVMLGLPSGALISESLQPWLLLGVSGFMIATFGVGLSLSGRARVAERARAGLDRVGGRWLRSWLERNALRFQRADDHLLDFFERERGALALPMLLYSAGWLVRGVETYVFLQLLEVDVPFATALVVETAIIVVRSVAVPVPAGLGVQDVGYVLCLKALGVPEATTVGTAFVVLKRGKDLFWILLGFALMAIGKRGSAASGEA